ncbi:hypothetical protein A2853_03340 [Candidatus Kaiserbacteria bacterium RIFCSPHIGHO2_01_FULL_55_17]|uniref:DNA polymerase III delta N-terminal domain-containing protein n=1 Tax=Candidatus Kaiserbacteria bacterium RIFCSPHIGHO2_01_FULL_55_17 TaxID=1798484 RepID=A0A1F6D912_9BACT|nr:MAG: hypothetical protein A2853_03340 [Candidatus Kaiserbacteria bacterium RIFCSPHIGHO2_01_FULL_55_17]
MPLTRGHEMMMAMLYLFTGSDRAKTRGEMNKALARAAKGAEVVRVTDANSTDDLRAVLSGGGMFAGKRAVVLDGVFANEEMKILALEALTHLKESDDPFFIFEEKLDVQTRKTLEKHAEGSERFDLPAGRQVREGAGIFSLAYALKGGDKKRLWVEYQRALSRDEAPEAIHGVLFWGAKDMFLRSKGADHERATKLVAELAELPHQARRRGFELEYALEHYILGINKS